MILTGKSTSPTTPPKKNTLGRDASISASGAGDASIAVIQGHKENFGFGVFIKALWRETNG